MKRGPRMVIWFVCILAATYLVVGVWVYANQRRLVFVPSHHEVTTPETVGLTYENVTLSVGANEQIHGWYFPVENASQTVLFCHGNAGNISSRLPTAQLLTSLGVNVLLFDYRGYGRSTGTPSEQNCYEDALAAWQWLTEHKQLPPDAIIIFGRSLGGAVAVETATRVPCGGLIVESSFTSIAAMGRRMFAIFPTDWLVRYRFASIEKIGRVSCPVLITHSRDDTLIPFEMGRELFAAAAAPKGFLAFSGDHNDREYLNDPRYRQALAAFLTNPEIVKRSDNDGNFQPSKDIDKQ
ncbi:MAG: alpha/beta hydrolase [Candidatus Zixiibacteriota bacterium]|nr:MAG: alpha/beta hydrolase [candidate division Zixibacteria bacterium]